jgi:hypothetical protein
MAGNPYRQSWREGSLNTYLQQAPELLQDAWHLTTSHLAGINMPIDAYQVQLTTDGSANAAQSLVLPNPATAGNGIIGQRHLVNLENRANASDTVSLATTYLKESDGTTTPSTVILSANGKWALLEHRGSYWMIVASASGVVT